MSNLKTLLEQLLSEQLYEDVDEIAAYPEGFDIKQFITLSSVAAKTRYLKQHNLDKLGTGSGRAVFVADENTVIKVAKNAKGLAQNEAEVDISYNSGEDAPVAKVKDCDEKYSYIEAERARKAKPTDFKKIVWFPMEDVVRSMCYWAHEVLGRSYVRSKPETYDAIMETPFMQELTEIMGNFDIETGDLSRISSWGVVSRDGKEHLVLVDYGATTDILNRLYMRP